MNYTLRASYNCYDSKCQGRATTIIYKDSISEQYTFKNLEITKKHSLDCEEHSYIVKNIIKKDIINDVVDNDTKQRLYNYRYRLKYLKLILFSNKISISNFANLKNYYITKYNIIDYRFNDLSANELAHLQKIYKITDHNNMNNILRKKITLDKQIYSAINFYHKKNFNNKDNDSQIINLEIMGEKNIVNNLYVEFERKNIIYKKNINILMIKLMSENISNPKNIQYFDDTRYNTVPYSSKKIKLWVLVAFNKVHQRTILCCLALIKNENKETYLTIFDYLKNKYKSEPKIMTVDFGRGCYTALKDKFENINIILCYYHFLNRLKLHIKSSYIGNKKDFKKIYKYFSCNVKLLSFLETDLIEDFLNNDFRIHIIDLNKFKEILLDYKEFKKKQISLI